MLLPKIPFVSIEDFRVAVDAPVSTDLMTDIAIDLNYLKSVVTDGALAPQGINTSTITGNGQFTVNGNAQVNGDEIITGNLTIGGGLAIGDIIMLLTAL